jgi:hypothetical protein
VDTRREPLRWNGLKDEVTLGDRKFHPATGAREFPILGVARSNAVCWFVVDDQRTASKYRAARRCRNYVTAALRCLWQDVLMLDSPVPLRMAAPKEANTTET